MKKALILGYGLVSYLFFFVTFVYLAAFIGDLGVPKSINRGAPAAGAADILLNALFPILFAVQHTVMARPRFKTWFTRIIPVAAERATFVLIASLILAAMMWQWKVMPTVLWDAGPNALRWILQAVFFLGWLMVLYSSFLIDHFDLFGLRQVWLHWHDRPYTSLPFRTPLIYGRVRHPLYVAWALAFWSTPTMTAGHLLLAAGLTAYMVAAVVWEERDLIAHFGEEYLHYRRRVPKFFPRLRRSQADRRMKADSGEFQPAAELS